ncbi:unnamed protein product [Allacma fusca]|uniref:Uncharacterized protein n=1 Tax=Allacma fusca TaxID=39272 RepID=A0A8J2NIP1_9HEXA|nr:unnamed protein product [Allacma fusca]
MESLVGSSTAPSILSPTLADTLEATYVQKRDELLMEDGVTCTPLKVLKDLCFEYGCPIEVTTFEVHLPFSNLSKQDSIRNRVILKAGQFTGHGEASRHRLGLQLAAADLLEKTKVKRKDLPEYGLLPGCRISPMIYQDLRELCRMEELASMPHFVQVCPSSVGSEELYSFKCLIGQAETIGTSDSIFLAKRMAAKAMFEMLTGEKYPDDRIATGSGCLRFEDLQAMGINPVMSVRGKQRKTNDIGCSEDPAGDGINVYKSQRKTDDNEGLHVDDFAEDEDNVVVMREQLKTMNLV